MWLLGNPTPEQDIAEAHGKRAEGFGFFKLKIGTKPVDTEIAATLALRDALGAATPLCADANCGLSFADARRYVEGDARSRSHVRRAAARARRPRRPRPAYALSPIPIGADEGIHSLADIEEHKRCGAGGVSLKLIKLGGMSAAVEAAQLCARLGLAVNVAAKIAEFEHRLGGGDPPRLRGARGRLGREPHAFLSRRGYRARSRSRSATARWRCRRVPGSASRSTRRRSSASAWRSETFSATRWARDLRNTALPFRSTSAPDKAGRPALSSPRMQPITDTKKLAEACARLARHPFVTVDTEFLRESTYYPKLCVLQMASTGRGGGGRCARRAASILPRSSS